ncbi:MAG: DMT family transporter [Anaerovoracaceae bacterium]
METRSRKNNDILIGCGCAFACELVFGLSYIFTRQITAQVSPFALLGWRFFTAFLVMSVCAKVGILKIQLKGKSLKPLLKVAFFSPVIYFTGETLGIQSTTASESGAMLACIPVVSLAASALLLHEPPSKKQITGILITLAGVLVTVFAAGSSSSFSAFGYGMLTLAVLSYALYSVCAEKAQNDGTYSGAEITFAMLAAGAAVFGCIAVLEAVFHDSFGELIRLPFSNVSFLAAVLYQGIGCSIIAFFLSNVAIGKAGVNRTSSFIGVSTVVSIVAGVLLLEENFTALQVAGTVLILTGVYVANVTFHSGEEKREQ